MQYKNKFLDIIKNLQKNLLVKNYNYTHKDRFDLDKKSKTFDESFRSSIGVQQYRYYWPWANNAHFIS